jgi:flagellar basal body-associated protein FliL
MNPYVLLIIIIVLVIALTVVLVLYIKERDKQKNAAVPDYVLQVENKLKPYFDKLEQANANALRVRTETDQKLAAILAITDQEARLNGLAALLNESVSNPNPPFELPPNPFVEPK